MRFWGGTKSLECLAALDRTSEVMLRFHGMVTKLSAGAKHNVMNRIGEEQACKIHWDRKVNYYQNTA